MQDKNIRLSTGQTLSSLHELNFGGSEGGPMACASTLTGASGGISVAECDVVVQRLDVSRDLVRQSSQLLSADERSRAGRFIFERDCRRFTVARARLRQLLSARLSVRPQDVEFIYGLRGKPSLVRHQSLPDVRFNVSHSGDLALFAFAVGREIGVDLEALRTIDEADDIAERCFSPSELKAYLALDQRDKPLGFFNCWTRKEAFIKALGDGFYFPLDRFDVTLGPSDSARLLRVGSEPGDSCGWTMEGFAPSEGYVAAVVVQSSAARSDIHLVC